MVCHPPLRIWHHGESPDADPGRTHLPARRPAATLPSITGHDRRSIIPIRTVSAHRPAFAGLSMPLRWLVRSLDGDRHGEAVVRKRPVIALRSEASRFVSAPASQHRPFFVGGGLSRAFIARCLSPPDQRPSAFIMKRPRRRKSVTMISMIRRAAWLAGASPRFCGSLREKPASLAAATIRSSASSDAPLRGPASSRSPRPAVRRRRSRSS